MEICVQVWGRLEKVMPNSPLRFVTQEEQQGFVFSPNTWFQQAGTAGTLSEESCGLEEHLCHEVSPGWLKFHIYGYKPIMCHQQGSRAALLQHRFLAKLHSRGWASNQGKESSQHWREEQGPLGQVLEKHQSVKIRDHEYLEGQTHLKTSPCTAPVQIQHWFVFSFKIN